jgi:hypothetical protein
MRVPWAIRMGTLAASLFVTQILAAQQSGVSPLGTPSSPTAELPNAPSRYAPLSGHDRFELFLTGIYFRTQSQIPIIFLPLVLYSGAGGVRGKSGFMSQLPFVHIKLSPPPKIRCCFSYIAQPQRRVGEPRHESWHCTIELL